MHLCCTGPWSPQLIPAFKHTLQWCGKMLGLYMVITNCVRKIQGYVYFHSDHAIWHTGCNWVRVLRNT